MTIPQSENTIGCFAYLRVSGKGQLDGDGYERQAEACREYATAHGMEIVETFRECMTGKSDLEDRPALSELLVALEENGIKTVIVEKLDRLARDLMIQETIVADMLRRGFTLISTMEPDLCSTDPSRVLVRQIFGAISQYEKTMLVMKMRAARVRIRAKQGSCEGAKPYGVMPGESETLVLMRELRVQRMTYTQIAAHLNGSSIPTRSGGTWSTGTVHRILTRR